VGKVHDRMPFIVEPGQYGGWFDGAKYQHVLGTPDRRELESRAVQRALNNVKNEGAELIRPGMVQGTLF
jgi:putative SOS response-associated peptidase YedK